MGLLAGIVDGGLAGGAGGVQFGLTQQIDQQNKLALLAQQADLEKQKLQWAADIATQQKQAAGARITSATQGLIDSDIAQRFPDPAATGADDGTGHMTDTQLAQFQQQKDAARAADANDWQFPIRAAVGTGDEPVSAYGTIAERQGRDLDRADARRQQMQTQLIMEREKTQAANERAADREASRIQTANIMAAARTASNSTEKREAEQNLRANVMGLKQSMDSTRLQIGQINLAMVTADAGQKAAMQSQLDELNKQLKDYTSQHDQANQALLHLTPGLANAPPPPPAPGADPLGPDPVLASLGLGANAPSSPDAALFAGMQSTQPTGGGGVPMGNGWTLNEVK